MEQSDINTPEPPYYTVVFSSQMGSDTEGYPEMVEQMLSLASAEPGFLGIESAQNADGSGITVSYWRDEAAILRWKGNLEHQVAQTAGRERFYQRYSVRVGRIERAYDFTRGEDMRQ